MKKLFLKRFHLFIPHTKAALFGCFAIFLLGTNAWTQDATFSSSNTWVAPVGVTCVTINAWGAGGGGGGSNSTNSSGGGGGGAFVSTSVKVIPGQTYTITIGAGGAGGASGSLSNGVSGGATTFKDNLNVVKVQAAGGQGGQGNTKGTGAATSGNIPVGVGFKGGDGFGGLGSSTGGGAGGGGGGTAANGSAPLTTSNATKMTGGLGGATGGGKGGNGATNTNAPNAGAANGAVAYGGGGGGVSKAFTGGSGAGGYLTITYTGTCPVDPIELVAVATNPATVCQDSTYQSVVTVKNNTGSAIASGATTYAIDYSWNNSTWTNNAAYTDNMAIGATNSYNFNMTAINAVGPKVIYIRVRKVSDGTIVSSGTGMITVDYCPKGADNCIDATQVNISGTLQGNTANYSADNGTWMTGSGAFGGATVENNGWYKFTASSSSIVFTLCAGNCDNNTYGLQFNIFAFNSGAGCGSGSISGKFFRSQLSGNTCLSNQTVSGLTVGQTYYMMIDGYEGADCPYSLQYSSGIVLPIELTYFTGRASEQGNLIQWETASERMNDYFILESTLDGMVFNKIAQVTGAGNSSTALEYRFLDKNPAGYVTYYRLRQVDYNGESKTFDLISVKREFAGETFISPNPVINHLNIETEVHAAGNYTFALTNMLGKRIESKHDLEKGHNFIELNTSELAKGLYMLHISDMHGETLTVKKVIKQ